MKLTELELEKQRLCQLVGNDAHKHNRNPARIHCNGDGPLQTFISALTVTTTRSLPQQHITTSTKQNTLASTKTTKY